ncbi:radical SAM protein [uncultured Paludibaculum sp.]|uniref:B12-binding domain-containing radical SAM protein n=1 Tax=uncultured Paludibaculum sp. TaxID=1765020 RepID=UPI002AAA6C22|nr:radical SAM protein [uncultured Paludibaculum sp.]
MRVTLVYPSMGRRVRAVQMQPLTIAALAGLAPGDVNIRFFDDRFERIDYNAPTDLAAISVQTFAARRAYEIADEFRRRGIPVVLGGFHVTAVPEEAAQHADAVVIGAAEESWPRALEDARNGRLQPVYRSSRQPSLAGLRYRREVFTGKRYLRIDLVEFGRGCPYACGFCSVAGFFGSRKECRPVTEVVEEIRHIPGRFVEFVDDNLIGDVSKAKELLRALIPLRIRWVAQAGIEFAFDDELLDLAAASGCAGLLVGFESLSEGSLRQMGKSARCKADGFAEAISRLHARKIRICASFLFGYDEDTPESFSRTLAFANGQKFMLALFNHLTPFPGTPVYEQMEAEGRLRVERWWLTPGFRWGDVIFDPKHFSAGALADACRENRRVFYQPANILRRAISPANRTRFVESLALNFLVRKDVLEKQGFPLGRGQS